MKEKEAVKPDVIVAFGFSKKGAANRAIARAAIASVAFYGVPVFTQDDVLHEMELRVVRVQSANEERGYLSTLGICKQFKYFADRNWNHAKIRVIAAPMHQWWCERDLKRLGFEIFEPPTKTRVTEPQIGGWYNPSDPQIWVRNRWIWWSRELILRALPWFIYQRIV